MSVRMLNHVKSVALLKRQDILYSTHQRRGFLKLSDELKQIQKVARIYSNKELQPIAGYLDKNDQFPAKQIQELADLGLMGITADQKYGGSGMSLMATCLAVEELSKGCAGTGIIVSIHNCLYVDLINRLGTDRQKDEFLTQYTTGFLGAFALSESSAGSDVANMETKAIKDGDFYILQGVKAWVTSGAEAKSGIIFATIDKSLKHKGITAFLVPFNSSGLELGRKENKMGIKASSTCDVILDDVRVSKDNVLGNVGEGFKMAMRQLQAARIGVASQALGIAQASLDLAVTYANNRIVFGKELIEMQMVKSKISNMAVDLEAARLLTWKAAFDCDSGKNVSKISSMAKYAASRCATSNANDCVQILGGLGYTTDAAAERHYRDARITQIYGGVNEIQQLIIADEVSKGYK